MHAGHSSEEEPMAEMNLIPLIDISLTLLIIMMITTTFVRAPGFALKLPEASTRQGKPETPKDRIIGVNSAGQFYLDGVATDDAQLLQKLKAAYAQNHEMRVLVKGDKEVPYGRVSAVMDIISQANIKHINLPTEPKRDTNPAAPPAPR